MPPAFCTQSASDQCHAIPHEHSPDTPNTALDACVPAKPLWIRSGSRRCLRVLCEDPLSHPSLLAWRNYSSQSFGASSILLLKAAGTTYMHPKFLTAVICAPSQTILFPGAERRQG